MTIALYAIIAAMFAVILVTGWMVIDSYRRWSALADHGDEV